MKAPTLLISISLLLCKTAGGVPRWSWGKLVKDSTELVHCPKGSQCTQLLKCSEHATEFTSHEACDNKDDEPWICCTVRNDVNYQPLIKSESTNSSFEEHFLQKNVSRMPETQKTPLLVEATVPSINASDKYIYISDTIKENSANSENNETWLIKENRSLSLAEYRHYPNPKIWLRSYASSPRGNLKPKLNSNPSLTEELNTDSSKSWNGDPADDWEKVKNHQKPSDAKVQNNDNHRTLDHLYLVNTRAKATENFWDNDYPVESPEMDIEYWDEKPPTPSPWKATKNNWDRDYTPNSIRKTTNGWENRRTTSNWKKTTKPSWDTNHTPKSERSSTSWIEKTPSLPSRSSTKDVWHRDHTTRAHTKSTKAPNSGIPIDSWRKPTEDAPHGDFIANIDRKSTKVATRTTTSAPRRKPIPWGSYYTTDSSGVEYPNGRMTSSTSTRNSFANSRIATKSTKSTAAYSRSGTSQGYSTKKTSSRTSLMSTKRNWVASTERTAWRKSSITTPYTWVTTKPTKITNSYRHSSTKKLIVSTPLPNVNTHVCGIRDTNSGTSTRRRNARMANNPDAVTIYPEHRNLGKDRSILQRIVGGKEAEPFSWPWVAALYRVAATGGNRFLCAGSLINENFILTAAHVFTPDDLRSASFVVMLGTHTAKEAVAEYRVSSVLQHPRYQHRYYYNDIALLRLERAVVFNDYVMPICLPSPSAPLLRDNDLVGKRVTVMGWGDESYGGITSRVLKEATFPILSRRSCNASYIRVASNRFPNGITDNLLCAGDPNGGKDACQGDSGGPLTTFENGRYTQVGIVSFGYKCGDKDYPGVYTKVAPYLSWIAENARCDDRNDFDYYAR